VTVMRNLANPRTGLPELFLGQSRRATTS